MNHLGLMVELKGLHDEDQEPPNLVIITRTLFVHFVSHDALRGDIDQKLLNCFYFLICFDEKMIIVDYLGSILGGVIWSSTIQ